MVELLLKRRANVAATDRKGNTALDLAQDEAVRAALQAALQEAKVHQKTETPAKEVTCCTALASVGAKENHNPSRLYAAHIKDRRHRRRVVLARVATSAKFTSLRPNCTPCTPYACLWPS